jgi:predicted DNA-binding transcriptional regulator AlpA
MTEKLVDINKLASMSGLSVRNLRTLMSRNAIPFLKLGFRTVRFEPSKVAKALQRREVRELAPR